MKEVSWEAVFAVLLSTYGISRCMLWCQAMLTCLFAVVVSGLDTLLCSVFFFLFKIHFSIKICDLFSCVETSVIELKLYQSVTELSRLMVSYFFSVIWSILLGKYLLVIRSSKISCSGRQHTIQQWFCCC